MNLAPLLEAKPVIQLHAYFALGALGLGFVQLVAPKGTLPHRTIGWIWVTLMTVMLVSGYFIHDVLAWGPFSTEVCRAAGRSLNWTTRCGTIHVITIAFLLSIPYAVLHAHRHNVDHHKRAMLVLLLGALFIAALFTLDTDRIMHAVVFGTPR